MAGAMRYSLVLRAGMRRSNGRFWRERLMRWKIQASTAWRPATAVSIAAYSSCRLTAWVSRRKTSPPRALTASVRENHTSDMPSAAAGSTPTLAKK